VKNRSQPNTTALSRRRFVGAGLTVGGAALFGLPALTPRAFGASTVTSPYSATRPVLDLEGVAVPLAAVSGGAEYADPVKEPDVGDGITHLRPGVPKVEDIVIQLPLDSVPPSLLSWINGTLAKNVTRKSGAIAYVDLNMAQRKRLEFTNAFLTEVTLPACDATDKSIANLTLRLTPDRTQLVDGGGAKPLSLPPQSQKHALNSNFMLSVEKLENASRRTMKISPISAKRPVVATTVGTMRDYAKSPSSLELSIVSIVLPEQDALPFYTSWFATSTLAGNSDERGVLIDWFGPDLTTKIATAAFGGAGILRYEPLPTAANGDTIAQVQIDLYVETLTLKM